MLKAGWVYPDLATPGFSARECAKQLILLEDHLACPGKGCPDCISKHKLAAEAFAEEALQLGGREPWLSDLPAKIRGAGGAQDYRAIRKDVAAHLREVGMAGLVGLGRFRGVGLGEAPPSVTTFIIYFPVTNMDPILWASSEPAFKLGLQYVGPANEPGQHFFRTATNPSTVMTLLKQDQRVGWAEMVSMAAIYTSDEPVVVSETETRPEPGKPETKLPGYVPKDTRSGTSLTEVDQAQAAFPPGVAKQVAAVEQSSCKWWLLVLAAYLLSRR